MKLKDIIENVPEIANFTSQEDVLRLSNENFFHVNGKKYELRMFTFIQFSGTNIENRSESFRDYIKRMNLEDAELKPPPQKVPIKLLSYSNLTNNVYIILSVSPK